MNSKVRSSDPGSQENKHSIKSTQNRKQLTHSDSLGQGQYKIVIGGPQKNNQTDNKNKNNREYQHTISQENSAILIDQMTQYSQYNIIAGQSVYIESKSNSRAQSCKSNTKQVVIQNNYQQKQKKPTAKVQVQGQFQENLQINSSRMLEESSVIDSFHFQSQKNGNNDSHFQEVQFPTQVQNKTKTVAKTNNSDTLNFMKLLGEAMTQNMTRNYKANSDSNANNNNIQYLDPRTSQKQILRKPKEKLIQTRQAVQTKKGNKNDRVQENALNIQKEKQKEKKKIELNKTPSFDNTNQKYQHPSQYNENYFHKPISPIYQKDQYNSQNFYPPTMNMQNFPHETGMDNFYQLQMENSNLLYELNRKESYIQNLINENTLLKNKEKQLKSLIFDMQQSYKLKEASYQDQIYELNRRNQLVQSQLIKRIQDNLTKQRENRLIQLLKKQQAINKILEIHSQEEGSLNDSNYNFNSSLQEANNIPTQRYFVRNDKTPYCQQHRTKKNDCQYYQQQQQEYDKKTVQNKEFTRQSKRQMNLDEKSLQSSIIRRVKSQEKPFNIQYRHLKQAQTIKPNKKKQLQLQKLLHSKK